jgi:hypothetical protein
MSRSHARTDDAIFAATMTVNHSKNTRHARQAEH